MRVLFPFSPLNEKEADGPFHEEYLRLKELGTECSLFDFDSIQFDEFRPKPRLIEGETVLYRGWMFNHGLYTKLSNFIKNKGAKMVTDPDTYLKSHHLPNWYDNVREFTPETITIECEGDVIQTVEQLGWTAYFVKDFVKSNYNERGSIATTPQEIMEIIDLIKTYRGEIEGGVAIRRVEAFVEESEKRYFVINGTAYAQKGHVPAIVNEIVKRHNAPFYSVDMIKNTDDEWRLIEIGDGQVSDRKSWDPVAFCDILVGFIN